MNSEQFNSSNTVFFLHDICKKGKNDTYRVGLKLVIRENTIETQFFHDVTDIAFNYNMMIIHMNDDGENCVRYYRLEHVVEWKAEVDRYEE